METDDQLMVKEEPWCGVDQQDPENLHIKEEQEEVSIKNEDDEEKPLLSQLQQQQIEDRDVPTSSSADQMTAETNRNPDVNPHEPTPESSETEVSGDDEEDDDVNLDSESETRDGDKDLNEGSFELGVKRLNTTFSCPECGKQFIRKSSLQKHLTVTSHSAIRSSGCLVNKKCVGVKQDSCRIVQKKLKPFKCDFCGKGFSNNSKLKLHLRGPTDKKLFACNFCSQRFSHKKTLKLQTGVHIEEKPHKCKICKRRFRLKSQLKSHKNIHERQNPHACEICKQIFSDESILKSHMKIHNRQKPIACQKCNKIFCDKSKLKSHMKVHKRQNSHACKICKKRFSHKSKLNRHLKYYQRQNPLSCEVCGQRFAQEELLTSHMSIHTVLNHFVCEHCGQKFSKKSFLTHHAIIHTAPKPFACELCGQRFRYKNCLGRHMRVHTDGVLLPVRSVDRYWASRESTQTSSLTSVRVGSKQGELCSDPLKKAVYVKLQPLNTSAEMSKTTDKPTQATREPKKEDNSRGNLNSQTTCAANIPAAPLTRADMEFMLQGLEDQITSKLSAQFTENQALLEQQDSTIEQLETSINNMRNQMLELEATCSMLMQENEVLKLKPNDPENGFRHNNICITGLPEKAEGPYTTVFITEFLTEIFGPEAFPMPLVVNVAHRIGVSNPNHEPPRPLIARVHHFQNKELILKLAQERDRLTYRGTDIHILPYHGPRYPRRGQVPA